MQSTQRMVSLQDILEKEFKKEKLKPEQNEIVQVLLKGRDCFVLCATGYGKSLCYQLPALYKYRNGGSVSFIVSPLISLIEDQVEALKELNIPATFSGSSQTDTDIEKKI